MRRKQFLAAILLGVSFYFVSGVGYGKVLGWLDESKISLMRGMFLEARIDYMMTNPTSFLNVSFYYEPTGVYASSFPESVDPKGKTLIIILDNRDQFTYKSRIALLDTFKRDLQVIYSFIDHIATDMDTDIIAKFHSGESIPLGYFYQGEYYLWED